MWLFWLDACFDSVSKESNSKSSTFSNHNKGLRQSSGNKFIMNSRICHQKSESGDTERDKKTVNRSAAFAYNPSFFRDCSVVTTSTLSASSNGVKRKKHVHAVVKTSWESWSRCIAERVALKKRLSSSILCDKWRDPTVPDKLSATSAKLFQNDDHDPNRHI